MSYVMQINKIGITFGGLVAVDNFSLNLEQGKISGLIGPNGAGKTTVFNMLTNVYEQDSGDIILNGINTKKLKTYQLSKLGIARTFQNIRLFKNMTVAENVKLGLHNDVNYRLISSFLRLPKYWKEEKRIHKKTLELLDIMGMRDLANSEAGSLPYGAQRRLEIVRALATDPKVLLLDEPAAGMNHSETLRLMETIQKIRDIFKISILLIEHDMNLVMGICEDITVLNYGRIIATGTPDEIKENPKVIEAYLGKKEEE